MREGHEIRRPDRLRAAEFRRGFRPVPVGREGRESGEERAAADHVRTAEPLPEISGVEREHARSTPTPRPGRAISRPAGDADRSGLVRRGRLLDHARDARFPAKPHMIVDVQYADSRLSGPYQVKNATHVINAADHFMDFKLRANGLPRAAAGVAAMTELLEHLDRVVEPMSQRYFGKYRGSVVDTADSDQPGAAEGPGPVRARRTVGVGDAVRALCRRQLGFFALPPVGDFGLGRVRRRARSTSRSGPAASGRTARSTAPTPRRASSSGRPRASPSGSTTTRARSRSRLRAAPRSR